MRTARLPVVAALLGLASVAVATGPSAFTRAARQLTHAEQEVYTLGQLVSQVRDPQLRYELRRSLDRVDAHLTEARVSLDAGPPRTVRPGPTLRLTSAADLGQILAALRATPFDDDRLDLLRTATAGRAVTTSQVTALMATFSFSDAKVDAAAMLYPQVVDPHDWYKVFAHLTFSSDADELRARTSG